jgi:protein-S-isoprenylcysteine O-methyltransferase Ste14
MGLREKLINMFYRTATSTHKIRNFLTPVGFIFFVALVILFIAIPIRTDKCIGLPVFLPALLSVILGLLCAVIGAGLITWSLFYFIKAQGTPVPFYPPPKLVTAGPYAYVRNPMLTGLFILMFGFGFLFRSISSVLVFTPVFILISVVELRMIEEPELKKRLGEGYTEYMNKTPMFIPQLKRIQKNTFKT